MFGSRFGTVRVGLYEQHFIEMKICYCRNVKVCISTAIKAKFEQCNIQYTSKTTLLIVQEYNKQKSTGFKGMVEVTAMPYVKGVGSLCMIDLCAIFTSDWVYFMPQLIYPFLQKIIGWSLISFGGRNNLTYNWSNISQKNVI